VRAQTPNEPIPVAVCLGNDRDVGDQATWWLVAIIAVYTLDSIWIKGAPCAVPRLSRRLGSDIYSCSYI
jgi:hypothetical protein